MVEKNDHPFLIFVQISGPSPWLIPTDEKRLPERLALALLLRRNDRRL